jgi:uncharacterized OB-fold protein
MSENPNPTRCGNCGTMNPPGQEWCVRCRAPLTLTASAASLEGTPEMADEGRRSEPNGGTGPPEVVVVGGPGGAPIPVTTEALDLDPKVRVRD